MDQFDLYSKEVMKYFKNPKNIGVIKNADGIGIVGNPRCGDVMKVYLKVGQRILSNKLKLKAQSSKLKVKEDYIKDIKVQTLGCGAAIATSSMMTEMVKGKSLAEAWKITNQEVTKKLGGLPAQKLHCSVLSEQGIKKAIAGYRSRIKD